MSARPHPFVCHCESWTNAALGGEAMNTPACHGEERSDVAIHLKYLLIATARFAHLAMTKV